MTAAQIISLRVFIAEGLQGYTKEEFNNYPTIFREISDQLGQFGEKGLRDWLDQEIAWENSYFGPGDGSPVHETFSQIKDVIFGDIALVPPLMRNLPELCKWRLSVEDGP